MARKFPDPSDPPTFNPPVKGGGSSTKPSNPGLLTSTGGLSGASGLLMAPAINTITGNSIIVNFDPTNFNCEENAEYDFRQEVPEGQEGRDLTIHLIILKYREIGIAKFSINITVFIKSTDSFNTIQIPVSIPIISISKMTKIRKSIFPDGRIHTVRLTPPNGAIQGERPQVTITRNANSGPFAITKLALCGFAEESAQM